MLNKQHFQWFVVSISFRANACAIPRMIIVLNYDLCISQGSVAAVLRCMKWANYNHLRQVSSRCCMPKIIKICQSFTVPFKKWFRFLWEMQWYYQGLCAQGEEQCQEHGTRGQGQGLTKTARTRTRTLSQGQGRRLETKFKAKAKKLKVKTNYI